MSEPLLEVENLVRHYTRPRKSLFGKKPVVQALNGVSFEVHQGESFGIVGESGSGKSTLARAILALEEPTAGSVRFKGENLFALSPEKRRRARRHVQMVFQDPFGSLDPKHKVRSIVTEPLDLLDDIDAGGRDAMAADALTAVGLSADDLDKYPHEFSGGQRQRIAIARALITRPDLIVADEPVSALDVSVQAQVLNLMMDLQQRFDLTYVIISHDLSVVRHVTDRLAVMQSGKIVEQGVTTDIFDQPRERYTQALLDAVLDVDVDEEAGEALLEDEAEETSPIPVAEEAVSAVAAADDGAADDEAVEDEHAVTVDRAAALKAADAAIASAIAAIRGKDDGASTPEMIEASLASEPASTAGTTAHTADQRGMAEARPAEAERREASQPAAGGGLPPPPRATSAPSPRPVPDPDPADEPAMFQGQNLIGGRWRDAFDDRLIQMIDPSDGESFGYIARSNATDVDRAVKAAHRAMEGPWGRMPAFERGRLLARLAELVADRADYLARLEAKDVGKPLRQAKADALALARYFEFYGGSADKVHGQTIPYHDGYTVLTLREPHGVTGHIVPWNYPMQIIGRSVGAALAMGNACVLKPGEDASRTALEIAKLATEADLPPGVLNVVTGLGEEVGAALAAHAGIDHLSFTGSVKTGRKVQEAAAAHGAPVTLELGGKSPQILFADADLEEALPFVVNAAIQNAGQTCSAGSRVLVQNWIYDEVVHRLAKRFETLKVGPATRDLDCGPIISKTQLKRIRGHLDRARSDRIETLAEGRIVPDAPEGGFYARPMLFGAVPPKHPLAREEVFGPVLAAMRFTDEEEAVRIANSTSYGLVAGVWTRDGGRQMRLARAIKSGQVFINNYGAGGGVELPFGGVKRSGFGREKGFEALYGFSTLKTVAIRHGSHGDQR